MIKDIPVELSLIQGWQFQNWRDGMLAIIHVKHHMILLQQWAVLSHLLLKVVHLQDLVSMKIFGDIISKR